MLKKLLGIVRAPFLLLVPAALAPAYVIACRQTGALDGTVAFLVFVAALAAQVAVNALNEYEDFNSGLDFATQRTPFSGGSGTLVADTNFAPAALYVALAALLVTISIGGYFLWRFGEQSASALVVPGLLGIGIIIAYTRWINRFPLLCLFAPGVGFGLLMVNMSVLVLAGAVTGQALVASLLVALLACNLLLVNQLPDIEADRRVGRNHLAIAWGVHWAGWVYLLFTAMAYLLVIAAWGLAVFPAPALLACLTLPAALFVAARVRQFKPEHPEQLVPAMGINVAVTLLTPILLAVGLWLGSA